jgi:hypothetical protein
MQSWRSRGLKVLPVIRLRVQGLGAAEVVEVVRKVVASFADELESGALITVKALKTTCHRLPIGISG